MNLKNIRRILSLLILSDIGILSYKCDLIKENYSMLTVSPDGYLLVLLLCLMLALLMYLVSKNKWSFLILLAGLVPFSFTHEIFAYISFFTLTIIFFMKIYRTPLRDLFVFLVMIVFYLYLNNYAAVNALCETVYLTGIVILSWFI